MTGQDLKERREAADLKQWEVAGEMRVASTRISQLEAQARVTPTAERRYLDAIDRCLVAKTAEQAAAEAVA
jgi:transcriptional regulator with XRE-family HTH domain